MFKTALVALEMTRAALDNIAREVSAARGRAKVHLRGASRRRASPASPSSAMLT